MSSTKIVAREGVEARLARNDLNNIVQDWAIKNAHKIRRSCESCTYAKRTGSFSCSKYGVVPPLDVIIKGCDGYSDCDDIPF